MKDLQRIHNKEYYNEDPVSYCKECLSLKVRGVDGMLYCDKCGCTEIEEANIYDWEKMYAEKYAGEYLKM